MTASLNSNIIFFFNSFRNVQIYIIITSLLLAFFKTLLLNFFLNYYILNAYIYKDFFRVHHVKTLLFSYIKRHQN